MTLIQKLAGLAAVAMLTAAAPSPDLENGDFERADASGAPTGWLSTYSRPLGGGAGYEYGSVRDGRRDRGAVLRRTQLESDRPYGTFSQTLDASPYRGRKIRFRAWVRADTPGGAGAAGLWMRVNLAGGLVGFFDNMGDRPITGNTWQAYEIDTFVASRAETVTVGLILNGQGAAYIDDASIEILDAAPDPTGASMSPGSKAYLDAALSRLREMHINAGKVDWPDVTADAYAMATGARTTADTYGAIQLSIAALGEQHSFFDPPRAPSPPLPAGAAARPGQFNRPPTGELHGRVGLVSIPPLVTRTPEELAWGETYSTTLHDLLEQYDRAGACGWIVDLRGNGGGNMWPMLNGLSPILDAGPYGAFVTPGQGTARWVRQDGRIIIEGVRDAPFRFPSLRAASAPVAVLLGPQTLSSGEMTAVAFRGRPNTRFFGQPTGGFTTANKTVNLADGAALMITTSFIEDRNGVAFTGAIPPDQLTDLDQADEAAKAWLATQGCSANSGS